MAGGEQDGRCPRCDTPYGGGQEYCLECGARLPSQSGVVGRLGSAWRRRFDWYPGDWIWPTLLALLIAAVAGAASAIWLADGSSASDKTLVATSPGASSVQQTQTAPEPTVHAADADDADHDRCAATTASPGQRAGHLAGRPQRLDNRPRLASEPERTSRGDRGGAARAAERHEEDRRARLVAVLEPSPRLPRRVRRDLRIPGRGAERDHRRPSPRLRRRLPPSNHSVAVSFSSLQTVGRTL